MQTLQHDTFCRDCGYNLRTLPLAGRCPECGALIATALADDPDERAALGRLLARRQYAGPMAASGYPLDAFLIAHDAVRLTQTDGGWLGRILGGRPRHASAAELADAFAHLCRTYFNDPAEARELLAEWHLSTSEDLGRVVYAMVDAGLLTTRPGDHPDDFAGRYTLETLLGPSDAGGRV